MGAQECIGSAYLFIASWGRLTMRVGHLGDSFHGATDQEERHVDMLWPSWKRDLLHKHRRATSRTNPPEPRSAVGRAPRASQHPELHLEPHDHADYIIARLFCPRVADNHLANEWPRGRRNNPNVAENRTTGRWTRLLAHMSMCAECLVVGT